MYSYKYRPMCFHGQYSVGFWIVRGSKSYRCFMVESNLQPSIEDYISFPFRRRGWAVPANATQLKICLMNVMTRNTLSSTKDATSSQIRCTVHTNSHQADSYRRIMFMI